MSSSDEPQWLTALRNGVALECYEPRVGKLLADRDRLASKLAMRGGSKENFAARLGVPSSDRLTTLLADASSPTGKERPTWGEVSLLADELAKAQKLRDEIVAAFVVVARELGAGKDEPLADAARRMKAERDLSRKARVIRRAADENISRHQAALAFDWPYLEATTLPELRGYMRTCQRYMSRAAASLIAHNDDPEHVTPTPCIDELSRLATETSTRPFGSSAGVKAEPPQEDTSLACLWDALGREPEGGWAKALETVQRLVSAANSLEQHLVEGYKLKLASLWTALGRGPANRGGWREVLDAVAQLAAITSGVSSTSKAAHERQLLSQLWEAIGRTEGSRGSWADALESVQRLAASDPSTAHTPARVAGTSKSKLDFELERIVVAVGEDLDAIGRVLEKPRHTIGRPAVNVETDEEYRARLITATEEKHA